MQATGVLSDSARAEIDALLKDGITPTPAEIVLLNYLGQRVETPETRMYLARGRPVFVGGVTLWPLTMVAFDWLDRVRPGMDAWGRECAVGYAMCHGRGDGNELLLEGAQAEKAVKDWFKTLRCTRREYDEALAQVDAQDQRLELPKDPTGKTMTIGDFSAFLSSACGGLPEFWERRCAVGYACAVLSMFVLQNHADKRPCAQDPKIMAIRALGYAAEKIRKRHQERHGP